MCEPVRTPTPVAQLRDHVTPEELEKQIRADLRWLGAVKAARALLEGPEGMDKTDKPEEQMVMGESSLPKRNTPRERIESYYRSLEGRETEIDHVVRDAMYALRHQDAHISGLQATIECMRQRVRLAIEPR